MAKLKDLIYESKFLKREFGDPLPTFEDVMKQHQVNKFKEDLDSVDKEDDDVDNDGDSDASDDYLKNRRDVISKAIEKESVTEGWWDNMSDASQAAYIKKYGEAPGSAGDDEPKVPAPDSKSDKGKPRVSANPYDDNYGQEVDDEDDYDMGEVPGSRGTGPWTPEDDPDFEKGPSLTSAPGRVPDEDDEDDYDMGGDDRVPNQDFRSDPTDDDYSVYDDPDLARIPDEDDEESSGRTGNELSRETLMINGKQYNRISEGVKKQPKPKYEFSEFYKRFKR
jgi:hypothetical protein